MSRHDAITPGRAGGSTHFLVSPRPRVAAPQVRHPLPNTLCEPESASVILLTHERPSRLSGTSFHQRPFRQMESANPLAPLLFAEIRRKLPNISEKVLADQLRQTERDGILHRASASTVPPQVTYSLNPEGRNWFP